MISENDMFFEIDPNIDEDLKIVSCFCENHWERLYYIYGDFWDSFQYAYMQISEIYSRWTLVYMDISKIDFSSHSVLWHLLQYRWWSLRTTWVYVEIFEIDSNIEEDLKIVSSFDEDH